MGCRGGFFRVKGIVLFSLLNCCSPAHRERVLGGEKAKPPRLFFFFFFIEAAVGLPCLSRALRSPSNGGSEGLELLSL